LTDWDDTDDRRRDIREVQNISKANLLCGASIRRKKVDIQMDSFELATIENSHDWESKTTFRLSLQRARPANLEREPVPKIHLRYSIESVLQVPGV
jgi:hypothetical protein